MFKSINELDKLSFDDCVIGEISQAEDGMVFEVEALIIKPNNSQNTNFTESYAGTSTIKFENARLLSLYKSGYRYYNADGKLLEEVPNEPVLENEWKGMLNSFSGNYLCDVSKEDDKYVLEVEMADEEDGCQSFTYIIELESDNVIVTWEKYLNRVQH